VRTTLPTPSKSQRLSLATSNGRVVTLCIKTASDRSDCAAGSIGGLAVSASRNGIRITRTIKVLETTALYKFHDDVCIIAYRHGI
jgi:hypothetical protein